MINDIFMAIGWLGMILIILAYYLLSTERLKSNQKTYHLLNGLGGVFTVISAFYIGFWPSVVLNVFWTLVAVFAITKIIQKRK